ncbi:MAG: pitrilysin family protein [Candidatus Cloacimonadales bacterium]
MKINKQSLANGFSLLSSVDKSNPLVSLQLYVRIGSTRELDQQAGFSHLTEHLVFKSTRNYPQNSIMERVSFLGGNINAYTEFDTTCYYITIPSKFTAEAVELLTEIVRYANFSEADFQSEKKVVIEELKQYQDDPEDYFVEEIAQRYFRKNNYRKPIIGNLANLLSSTAEQLRAFYREYYSPSNCFLVATGDLDEAEMLQLLTENFGDWEPKQVKKMPLIKEDFPQIPQAISLPKKISSDMLAFVMPDLAETDPDANALELATKNFGIGKNSRLFHRLFEVEKLIDSLKVHSLSGLNAGITIYLVMPKAGADLNRIAEIWLEELKLFFKYGLSELEIKDKQRELLNYYRYSFEYVESLATALGNEEILSDYTRFQKYPAEIKKLDKAAVDNAIRRYYKIGSLQIYHLGQGKFDTADILQKIKSSEEKQVDLVPAEDLYQTRLDNGMKLVFKRVKGKPTVGVSISFRVSQLNETAQNLGTNLMTSGLLLYGNENRSYKQLMNFCTENGINLGISPSLETTNLKLKCFNEHLADSLKMIADILQKPLFPKQHFENLRATYSSNLGRIADYPQYYAHHLWSQMFFGKKSNMLQREGNKSSLRQLNRKRLIEWYRQYYHPGNMSMAIVGDFNFEEISATCEYLFGKDSAASFSSEQKMIVQPAAKKFQRKSVDLSQSNINLGGWACSLQDPYKSTAFHVLAQMIGGDANSLLFEELRENLGLSYSSHFGFTVLKQSGFYSLSALVDKERESEAIDAIYQVLESAKGDGITAENLQKTKNFIRGQRLMDQESVLSQAQTISVLEAIGLGYQFYLDRDKRLESVELEQMRQLAQTYFQSDKYYTHILD